MGADLCAIFVSLELSRSLAGHIAVARPRGEDVQAQRVCRGYRCVAGALFRSSGGKCARGPENPFQSSSFREAGLDGFWIHRVLLSEGIESHVVDAASIATSRRRRRAKTDRIDGETLLRALLARKARRTAGLLNGSGADATEDEDRRRRTFAVSARC